MSEAAVSAIAAHYLVLLGTPTRGEAQMNRLFAQPVALDEAAGGLESPTMHRVLDFAASVRPQVKATKRVLRLIRSGRATDLSSSARRVSVSRISSMTSPVATAP